MQEKNALVGLVKTAMEKRGMKPPDLIDASGADRSSVYRFLAGSINIKVDSLFKILTCLKLLQEGSAEDVSMLLIADQLKRQGESIMSLVGRIDEIDRKLNNAAIKGDVSVLGNSGGGG